MLLQLLLLFSITGLESSREWPPTYSFTSPGTNYFSGYIFSKLSHAFTHLGSEDLGGEYVSAAAISKKGTWDHTSFHIPSHNAALRCFDVSHKTQLAFQIRELTFGLSQADWYLHNLDGLSLLFCRWPFVSNVHTHTQTTADLTSVTASCKGRTNIRM